MFGEDQKSGKLSIGKLLGRVLGRANRMLAPTSQQCACCGAQRSKLSRMDICELCVQQIPWIRTIQCNVCGRYEACYDCKRREQTYYEYNRSCVAYNDQMKDLLALYKYRGNERLKSVFVHMLSEAYSRQFDVAVDYITYTPLSPQRLMERGFNQAEQLAVGVGQLHQIPILPILVRHRHTEKQSYKGRKARLDDMKEVFTIDLERVAHIPKMNRKVRILVIDDVYTTGSTLNECARIVTEALPAEVYGLTWAR